MDYSKYYKKDKIKPKEKVKFEREKIDYNIDAGESKSIDKTIYIFLITALILIPLFIKAHISEFVSPHLTFMSSGIQADIFSYYKYIFLILITIVIVILFIYKVLFLQYNIPKSMTYLFLGVLAVVVTLSAIFSPYKSIALHGMYNRHEGTITFLCYLTIFFVAANMKYTITQLHGFLYSLYPFIIINMVLGLAIFSEKDLLDIGWLHSFILGSIPEGAQVSEGAKLWATLSNPNFISGIGAVLTILFLVWAMFDKNKIRSIINTVIALLSYIIVLTAFSSSGFLTIVVLLPIVVVLLFLNQGKKHSAITLIAFVILATAAFVPLANKNPRVWDETFGFFLNTNPFEGKQVSYGPMAIPNSATLNIFKPLVATAAENDDIKFSIPTLPKSGIGAGTGRVYEWEKAIEVSMKRPIIGYGLDTFVYIFPQNDIEKKANLRNYTTIVDKPHNMYLGILVGSGAIALIAFLLMIGSILIKGLKVLIKRMELSEDKVILYALYTATVAYLVQAIFNDSVAGSGVIFWMISGILLSIINHNIRDEVAK